MTEDRTKRGQMVNVYVQAVHEHWPPELLIIVLERIERGEIVEVR